jgi:hypothetical protein
MVVIPVPAFVVAVDEVSPHSILFLASLVNLSRSVHWLISICAWLTNARGVPRKDLKRTSRLLGWSAAVRGPEKAADRRAAVCATPTRFHRTWRRTLLGRPGSLNRGHFIAPSSVSGDDFHLALQILQVTWRKCRSACAGTRDGLREVAANCGTLRRSCSLYC